MSCSLSWQYRVVLTMCRLMGFVLYGHNRNNYVYGDLKMRVNIIHKIKNLKR